MKRYVKSSVDWDYYDKFDDITDKYLPASGEGDTLATQIVTALTKLIYKWYNDGDVYDNTHYLQGGANDLSSYANWLYAHVKQKWLLSGISDAVSESDYEELLREMADAWLDPDYLEEMDKKPKDSSIYNARGTFKFVEYDEEEDEWKEDDEYDDADDEEYYE